jgi:hypothetical protein
MRDWCCGVPESAAEGKLQEQEDILDANSGRKREIKKGKAGRSRLATPGCWKPC